MLKDRVEMEMEREGGKKGIRLYLRRSLERRLMSDVAVDPVVNRYAHWFVASSRGAIKDGQELIRICGPTHKVNVSVGPVALRTR